MRSIRLSSTGIAALVLFAPLTAEAATYYVSPSGSDSAAGTEAAPLASLAGAQSKAAAGDTFLFKGGTYKFTSTSSAVGITLNKSGTSSARINYWAAPGETPILDFSGMTAPQRIKGIMWTGNYIHFKGFEIIKVLQPTTTMKESWAIRIEGGSNNILENLNVHDIQGPGIFILGGGNNLVLNCDSHHNYDVNSYNGGATPGENADGFGCHSPGGNNIFRGCRAWANSDDGYDFINSNGVCIVEHSWAWRNGFIPGTTTPIGNGAGFKGGGFTSTPLPSPIPRHRLLFNVSFLNRRQGFYANHQEGGIDWINNTSFNNGGSNYDMLADEGAASHVLRNNLAAGTGGTVVNLTASEVTASNNSWNLGVTVSNADFVNVTDSEAAGPRQADGSLPNIGFLHLAAGSDLIDKGVNAGFAYAGSAPDLGAFESGLTTTGGTSSSGGAASSSGGSSNGGSTNGGSSNGGTAGATTGGRSGGAGGVATTAGGSNAGGTTAGGSNAAGASGGPVLGQGGSTLPVAGAGGIIGVSGGTNSAGGTTPGAGGATGTAGATPTTQGGAATGSGGLIGAGGVVATSGATSAPTDPETDAGCACRVATPKRSDASLFGALLLACAAVVRRRVRR